MSTGIPREASFVPQAASGPRRFGLFAPLNPPITDWRDRRVWIVGASSGIGEALARELGQRGARLALSARRREALQTLADEAPAGSLVAPADVTDPASVQAALAQIVDAWGGVDLVVWLAGDYLPMRAEAFDLDRARKLIDANLYGVLNGLAAVLPVLLRQKSGGIAIVSSVAGYRGLPKALAYGPGKAAVINLAESLWLDVAPHGIGVWLVNPGFVQTPLTAMNDFRMPALIQPVDAAREMVEGFASGRFEIHFPKRFTFWMRLLRLLPYRLYFAAVRRATGL
jgi:NAD(P)-dependent dehydrogenase (short-subunit alcohol dehydrogenase family)